MKIFDYSHINKYYRGIIHTGMFIYIVQVIGIYKINIRELKNKYLKQTTIMLLENTIY